MHCRFIGQRNLINNKKKKAAEKHLPSVTGFPLQFNVDEAEESQLTWPALHIVLGYYLIGIAVYMNGRGRAERKEDNCVQKVGRLGVKGNWEIYQ